MKMSLETLQRMKKDGFWVVAIHTADLHHQGGWYGWWEKPDAAVVEEFQRKAGNCTCCGEPLIATPKRGHVAFNDNYFSVF